MTDPYRDPGAASDDPDDEGTQRILAAQKRRYLRVVGHLTTLGVIALAATVIAELWGLLTLGDTVRAAATALIVYFVAVLVATATMPHADTTKDT